MISAFGVDHGYEELEKGFNPLPALKTLGSSISSKTGSIGSSVQHTGALAMNAGKKLGGKAGKRMGQGGSIRASAGGQLKKLGEGMAARPGLTGGLAVGGATAGVGATGYAIGNRRR